MVVFGQSGFNGAKLVVFGKKLLCSDKEVVLLAKVVVFEQSDFIP